MKTPFLKAKRFVDSFILFFKIILGENQNIRNVFCVPSECYESVLFGVVIDYRVKLESADSIPVGLSLLEAITFCLFLEIKAIENGAHLCQGTLFSSHATSHTNRSNSF